MTGRVALRIALTDEVAVAEDFEAVVVGFAGGLPGEGYAGVAGHRAEGQQFHGQEAVETDAGAAVAERTDPVDPAAGDGINRPRRRIVEEFRGRALDVAAGLLIEAAGAHFHDRRIRTGSADIDREQLVQAEIHAHGLNRGGAGLEEDRFRSLAIAARFAAQIGVVFRAGDIVIDAGGDEQPVGSGRETDAVRLNLSAGGRKLHVMDNGAAATQIVVWIENSQLNGELVEGLTVDERRLE